MGWLEYSWSWAWDNGGEHFIVQISEEALDDDIDEEALDDKQLLDEIKQELDGGVCWEVGVVLEGELSEVTEQSTSRGVTPVRGVVVVCDAPEVPNGPWLWVEVLPIEDSGMRAVADSSALDTDALEDDDDASEVLGGGGEESIFKDLKGVWLVSDWRVSERRLESLDDQSSKSRTHTRAECVETGRSVHWEKKNVPKCFVNKR